MPWVRNEQTADLDTFTIEMLRVHVLHIIRGEPEKAPNTRETGSVFFVYILYVYIFVCLWGDHFSEERLNFERVR